MPVASKRRVEARKAAPIVAVEPEPQPQEIDLPPAIKVTALVFSYDSAPALRRCLAALEGSNDRASIEILVVDCGSHDESAQLDSEFSGITMLRLPRYFGRTKALNIGTRTATGEYLLFMTPEVEVLPTTIPSLVTRLESDPETVAVCPLLVDTQARIAEQFFRLPTPATGADLTPVSVDKSAEVFPVEYATVQAFLVRRGALLSNPASFPKDFGASAGNRALYAGFALCRVRADHSGSRPHPRRGGILHQTLRLC